MLNMFTNFAASCAPGRNFFSFPTWYQYLDSETVAGKCTPKVDTSIDGVIGLLPILLAIAEILLRLAGLVAVGFIIYGGFKYIVSQGEPDKIKDARSTIINSLIGLVVAMLATAIVTFVGRSLITGAVS